MTKKMNDKSMREAIDAPRYLSRGKLKKILQIPKKGYFEKQKIKKIKKIKTPA